MMRFRLNHLLLRNLTVLLGITVNEFEAKTGVTAKKLYYSYTINDIGFDSLVTICNALHIPISHFIVTDEVLTLGVKSDYVVSRGWKDITVDFSLMNMDMTIGRRKSVREVCKLLECSSKTYTKIFTKNDVTGVMTRDLLRLVGKSELFIGDYVIDHNRPIPLPEGMVRRNSVSVDHLLQCNKMIMEQEKIRRNLSSRIKNLQQRISELESENKRLRRMLTDKDVAYFPTIAAEDMV